ncbi:MAG: hypothetical protein AAF567_14155 [Actinomycetota bacterium]
MARSPRKLRLVAVALVPLLVAGAAFALLYTRRQSLPVALTTRTPEVLQAVSVTPHVPAERTVDSYRGLGAWVDGFDYSPPYANGGVPPLVPAAINEMADFGVETLYLQSGRLDDRSPDVLEDRWILAEFLMRADKRDMDVIAWYLPKWTEDDTDLSHLLAASSFDVLGYRFDGVAVDIEWNQDDLEIEERNRRFVTLTDRLRREVGSDPLGAIVLPPVQTEVINPTFWPDFPWAEIADDYDVWLPMSYWSFRTEPYGNGYSYNAESIARLRTNIGDPDALVHAIGGIGAESDAPPSGTEPFIARVDQLDGFAQSLVDTDSIGGSIYDWLTLDGAGKATMRNLFSSGVAGDLGAELDGDETDVGADEESADGG